jgi:hypothetical protein
MVYGAVSYFPAFFRTSIKKPPQGECGGKKEYVYLVARGAD